MEDLRPRIELAKRLVRATPPRGEEYLGMLQIVLNRETAWTQWKDVSPRLSRCCCGLAAGVWANRGKHLCLMVQYNALRAVVVLWLWMDLRRGSVESNRA